MNAASNVVGTYSHVLNTTLTRRAASRNHASPHLPVTPTLTSPDTSFSTNGRSSMRNAP